MTGSGEQHIGSVPMAFPPGHFYSPIGDVAAIDAQAGRIWAVTDQVRSLVPLKPQLDWLAMLQSHYSAVLPWGQESVEGLRFHHGQFYFWGTDALVWFGVLHQMRPRRVVEVGSGHSSHLLLDVNEQQFDNAMELTFIEPYPERLHGALQGVDRDRITILDRPAQDVPLDVYESLDSGDVLFIDSSHVSKCGSDVNHLFFEVLPRLADGVLVHVHDIFWPFEYPKGWIERGRSWNEAYLLRALLMDSRRYTPMLFVDQVLREAPDAFAPERGLHPEIGAHGSFWMRVGQS